MQKYKAVSYTEYEGIKQFNMSNFIHIQTNNTIRLPFKLVCFIGGLIMLSLFSTQVCQVSVLTLFVLKEINALFY